jgi:hypothetical protein
MYTLAGFEPGSSVPEADLMFTAPRRHTVVRKVSLGEKIQYLPRECLFFAEILSKCLILHVDWFAN